MPEPPAMSPRHLYGTSGPPLEKVGIWPGGGLVSQWKVYSPRVRVRVRVRVRYRLGAAVEGVLT